MLGTRIAESENKKREKISPWNSLYRPEQDDTSCRITSCKGYKPTPDPVRLMKFPHRSEIWSRYPRSLQFWTYVLLMCSFAHRTKLDQTTKMWLWWCKKYHDHKTRIASAPTDNCLRGPKYATHVEWSSGWDDTSQNARSHADKYSMKITACTDLLTGNSRSNQQISKKYKTGQGTPPSGCQFNWDANLQINMQRCAS
jgi:hypothetical protein